MYSILIDPASAKSIATMRLEEEMAAARASAMARAARHSRRRFARAPAKRTGRA